MAVRAFQAEQQPYTVSPAVPQHVRSISAHRHNHIEIFFNLSSPQTFLIEDQVYTAAPYDLIIVDGGETHAVSASEDGHGYTITVRPEFLLSLCTDQTNLMPWRTLDGTVPQHQFPLPEEAAASLLRLIQQYQDAAVVYGGDVLSRLRFVELMVMISTYCRSGPQRESLRSTRYAELLAPALRYIDRNLQETFSLQDMADAIGVSKCYLCRIFKKSTGITVNQYIISRRIGWAKELLRTGKNVTEVSSSVGFNDYSYFIKTFKAIAGITPAKYARAPEQAQ